jgi:hypothetical protein
MTSSLLPVTNGRLWVLGRVTTYAGPGRFSVVEVSDTEAHLVRLHRAAGRLAASLVCDPFAAETVRAVETYLPQAQKAADLVSDRDLGDRSALRTRICVLSQAAVDGRPGTVGGTP